LPAEALAKAGRKAASYPDTPGHAESCKPKANTEYSFKLQATSRKQIQNIAESLKQIQNTGSS